ncbi:alpha/beta hydrolase family protein [Chitinophaga japonensis]|uniref:Dipeptidyl aminopeptidase/acylaminoacyl peptidase n=1 Tax=Chitinophaga japonensis TaxID=104662 RepID=A0A562SZG0_CHIJA|nr:prolyl oligopeptidase family serine peptidase [Chitinophaga japonensis]TWI86679.1 dipeptidyl aminopeptidase/acylaminoacyl peptidase [Chitinophaga japonensis]
MKLIILLTLLQLYATCPFAQKPPLDIGTLNNWPQVNEGVITNDGSYVLYTISKNIYHNPPKTLMIHSISGGWKQAIPDVRSPVFTQDSRRAIFVKGQDSLAILSLGTNVVEYIPHVSNFQLYKHGPYEYLTYLTNLPDQHLVLHNLQTNKQRIFPNISAYLVSQNGNTLIYKSLNGKGKAAPSSLYWVKLPDGAPSCIDIHPCTGKLTLDKAGEQLSFVVTDTTVASKEKSFWYYKAGMNKAVLLADNNSQGIDNTLQLAEISEFSNDGMYLFISLKEKAPQDSPPNAVMVDIWSYTDPVLQSQQLASLTPKSYAAVLHIKDHRIIRLQQENEIVRWKTNQALCVVHQQGEASEDHWNTTAQRTPYIVSTANGKRRLLGTDIRFPDLSPLNKYVTGLEYSWENLYSYEIATGLCYNLTDTLPIPPMRGLPLLYGKYRGLQFAAWLTNEKGILAYDDFDIWLLDPEAKKQPVNITHAYGRRNNIRFQLSEIYNGEIAADEGKILLTAFNKTNKNSGFYWGELSGQTAPQLLTMGPYVYEDGGTSTIKAKGTNIYLVKRGCTAQSPNYFWTKDFKHFTPISDVFPEKTYNWMTAELKTFTTLDGKHEQGILYKPQNFNPARRYPLLIHYYEEKSQELHQYHVPAGPNGNLDIAWFVSHGYLVFTPDIHYTIGRPGQSALNAVAGAARYLSTFSWVDTKRMGIQGHSFGGFETNFIIAHTGFFAAAVSSSGTSDLISSYGACLLGGNIHQSYIERSQYRMGGTLWEKPELYRENSPILRADKVTTPLLLVANKLDHNVPFMQSVELFTALRRLGKQVWMLQYDNAYHGLRGQAYIDYVLRMTQFFDHYLKGTAAPVWMTKGIPARLKGIDTGLALDSLSLPPINGLLRDPTKKINKN